MADIVSVARRSRMMAGIRGRNTKPELALRRGLHRLGFRFRLHKRGIPGRPDLAFPRLRSAVFVHGCFWHRHSGCKFAYFPKSRIDFWDDKFESNVARDARQLRELRKLGWRALVVWECSLRTEKLRERTIRRVANWLERSRK
jgi:DNA mismatch endonuclease (patch repair protein)